MLVRHSIRFSAKSLFALALLACGSVALAFHPPRAVEFTGSRSSAHGAIVAAPRTTEPLQQNDTTIEVAITVDDLPSHGESIPGVTRFEIHKRMLDALVGHHVPQVYGFLCGGASTA